MSKTRSPYPVLGSPKHATLMIALTFVCLCPRQSEAQERYVFWIGSVDSSAHHSTTIFRYALSSGDVDTLIHAVDVEAPDPDRFFSHVTVDTVRNRIYWTDTGGLIEENTVTIGAIRRATIDGEDPEIMLGGFVCGLGGPQDIHMDPAYEVVYWGVTTDCRENGLYKWDFLWPIWEVLPISESFVVDDIDIDFLNGMMYWVTLDYFLEPPPGIVRSSLDVTAVHEYIVHGCVGDIALAHALSKIYWAPCSSNQIRRANLNGTDAEDVFVGEGVVSHLAIDHKEGKIYWTEEETGRLSRANLDGTDAEDLLTGLIGPTSLALSFGWDSHLDASSLQPAEVDNVGLQSVHPNPVRGVATIAFALTQTVEVRIEVYDALGRRVEVIASGSWPPGAFEVQWDASNRAAGVYFCRMTSGGRVETIPFVVRP